MIDYAHIKESFPKAFDTLRVWYEDRGEEISIDTDGELCSWLNKARDYRQVLNRRDLYDFFDEKGLFVSIVPSREWKNKNLSNVFCFEVLDYENYKHAEIYSTRPEAETAAFTKAFEILEERLNQEK